MDSGEFEPYQRTPSQGPVVDTDKIRRQAAEDMRRSLLLEQLSGQVTSLARTTEGVRDAVSTIKNDLTNGEGRMTRMERSLADLHAGFKENMKQLKAETVERIEDVQTQIEQHIEDQLRAERTKQSVWIGVVPGIITSVVASLATAAIVGGIVYNAVRSTTP